MEDGRKLLVDVYSAWTSVHALCKMEKGPSKRNVTLNRLLTLWITVQTKLPYRAEFLFRGLSSHRFMAQAQDSGRVGLSVPPVRRWANLSATDSSVTSEDSNSVAAAASQCSLRFFPPTHLNDDPISFYWTASTGQWTGVALNPSLTTKIQFKILWMRQCFIPQTNQ